MKYQNNEQDDADSPERLGPYVIETWLGRGGMGEVCRAWDERLGRHVAIKKIATHRLQDKEFHERLRREAQAAAQINHPSIVQVHDLIETDEHDWIVMEFVEGELLSRLLRTGPLELHLAMDVLRDIALGVVAVHAAEILHRDLKTDNVMVTPKGRGKLFDFGLARIPRADAEDRDPITGVWIGTPHAMSPEQVRNEALDHRTDLFALGTLMYETLTAQKLFRASNPYKTLMRVCEYEPPPARQIRPEIPPELSDLLERLLAKKPDDRPDSAEEVAAQLEDVARRFARDGETPGSSPHPAPSSRPLPSATSSPGIYRTSLIGRDEELALLLERWRRVDQGHHGEVVLLSGTAGIGKSLLVKSFLERLAKEGVEYWSLLCQESDSNHPFAPLADLLRRLIRHDEGGSAPLVEEDLAAFLETFGQLDDDSLSLFADLLRISSGFSTPHRLSPEARRRRTLEGLLNLVHDAAERQPLVVVVEDLHWADPSSRELFDLLVEQASAVPLLLLFSSGSELRPSWDGDAITRLPLAPLDRRQAKRLARRIAEPMELAEEILEHILEKSDGVPLFVEEITKSYCELHGDRRDGDEAKRANDANHTTDGDPLATSTIRGVPATLRETLEARLERLGDARPVAEVAAVLGRRFSYGLLTSIAPVPPEELERGLEHLLAADLVHRRGMGKRARFTFKHSLLRDAAYESLPEDRRRELHGRAAESLGRNPRIAAERPELLAHHHGAAGDLEPAVELWRSAAEQALGRSAFVEAVSYLKSALELVRQIPPSPPSRRAELLLHTLMGPALVATRGYTAPEVEATYKNVRSLCREVRGVSDAELVRWGIGSFTFDFTRAELAAADRQARELMVLAERDGDPHLIAEVCHTLGGCAFMRGEIEESIDLFRRGLSAGPADEPSFSFGHDDRVGNHANLALALWLAGQPRSALEQAETGISWAREIGHAFSEGFALFTTIWVHQMRREPEAARARALELRKLAQEQSFAYFQSKSEGLLGWAEGIRSSPEDAGPSLDRSRRSLAMSRQIGATLSQTFALALHAELCLETGLVDEAESTINEGLTACRRTGECFFQAELERLRGELLRRRNEIGRDLVERALTTALETARSQGAASLELRIALSLARVNPRGEATEKARNRLEEILKDFPQTALTIEGRAAQETLRQETP